MPWTQDAGVAPEQSGASAYRDLLDDGPLQVFGQLSAVLSAAKRDAALYDDGLSDLTQTVSPNALDPLAKARVQTFLGQLGDQQSVSNPEHQVLEGDPMVAKAHAAGWEAGKLWHAHKNGLLSGKLQDLADRLFEAPDRLSDEHLLEAQQVMSKFQEHTAGLDPDLKLPKGFRWLGFRGGVDAVRPFIAVDPNESFPPETYVSPPQKQAWFTAGQAWGARDSRQPSLVRLLAGAREGERLAVVDDVPGSDGIVASPNPDGTVALFGREAPRGFYPAQDLKHGEMHRLVGSVPTVVANIDTLLDQVSEDQTAFVQSHSSPATPPALQDGNHIVVEGKPEHMKAVRTMFKQSGFTVEDMQPFRVQEPDGDGVVSRRRAGVIVRLGNSPTPVDVNRAWSMVQAAKDDFYDVSPVAYLHGAAPEGSEAAWDNVYVDPAGRQVVHRTSVADPHSPNSVRAFVPAGTNYGGSGPTDSVRVAGNRVLINNEVELQVADGQVEQADDFLRGKPSPFRLQVPEHPYRQDGAQPRTPILSLGNEGPVAPRTVVGHVSNGRVTLEAPSDPEDVGQMLLHQARLVLGRIGVKT